jgi:hypothetical protein
MSSKRRVVVGIRLDETTLARVEAVVRQLSTEWHDATRSDVLRVLITASLTHLENDPEALRKLLPPSGEAGEEPGDDGEA